MKLQSSPQGLSAISRICFVILLSAILTGSLFAEAAFVKGLAVHLSMPGFEPTARALCMLGIWLLPLLLHQARKQISFHLKWTWTVLAIAPLVPLMNGMLLIFPFGATTGTSISWVLYTFLIIEGFASGVREEVIFRGYAFLASPERHPKLVVFTTALSFSLLHFANLVLRDDSMSYVLSTVTKAFVIGIAFGVIRIVTGSIGWPLLLHGTNNAIAFILPETAGKSHLQISFAIFVVCSVTTAVVFLWHPRMRGTHREHTEVDSEKPLMASP